MNLIELIAPQIAITGRVIWDRRARLRRRATRRAVVDSPLESGSRIVESTTAGVSAGRAGVRRHVLGSSPCPVANVDLWEAARRAVEQSGAAAEHVAVQE